MNACSVSNTKTTPYAYSRSCCLEQLADFTGFKASEWSYVMRRPEPYTVSYEEALRACHEFDDHCCEDVQTVGIRLPTVWKVLHTNQYGMPTCACAGVLGNGTGPNRLSKQGEPVDEFSRDAIRRLETFRRERTAKLSQEHRAVSAHSTEDQLPGKADLM